jgi:hypothetical protein
MHGTWHEHSVHAQGGHDAPPFRTTRPHGAWRLVDYDAPPTRDVRPLSCGVPLSVTTLNAPLV